MTACSNHGERHKSGAAAVHVALVLMLVSAACLAGAGRAHAGDAKAYVLCYHSFHGNQKFPGDVSLEELASQMDLLRTKGFRFVSLADLVAGRVKGAHNVLVTIDDGNATVYPAYRQVFRPRGIRPVLGIYPAIIGRKSYSLTWEQLSELARDGCEVGAHGYYHLHLKQEFREKDPKGFVREIAGSKDVLQERLGVKVKGFFYPNGIYSEAARQAVQDAGYSCAFVITWGPVLSPLTRNADPYRLSRYMIYQDNWGMVSGTIIRDTGP
ncbi:MAG TPA: polysaccharide deacetylase family protein [Deltaproteobacteria bacterium]|nr:polysaccharide deacetylase family protein [Deltaproteobacteria bacterium]